MRIRASSTSWNDPFCCRDPMPIKTGLFFILFKGDY
jgi:hypothetical protein